MIMSKRGHKGAFDGVVKLKIMSDAKRLNVGGVKIGVSSIHGI